MDPRSKKIVGWFFAGVAAALYLVSIGITLTYQIVDRLLQGLLFGVILLGLVAVSVLIFTKRPENPIGWIILFGSLLVSLDGFSEAVSTSRFLGDWKSLNTAIGWLGNWIGNLGFGVLLTFLFLYFPSGKLLSRRWTPIAWAGVFILLTNTIFEMLTPGPLDYQPQTVNPLGVSGLNTQVLGPILEMGVIILFLAGVVSIILRYSRAGRGERQQIKWVAFSSSLGVILIVLGLLGNNLGWLNQQLVNWIFIIFVFTIPVSLGIAILWYRLWDIDLIIRRTLLYGVLTAVLGLFYFLSVLLLQNLFVAVIGQQSPAALVVSTLGSVALFNPLRKRIQAVIDQRFYRKQYNAELTLQMFSSRLRDEVDLDQVSQHLLLLMKETMQPKNVSLWLKGADRRTTSYDPGSGRRAA